MQSRLTPTPNDLTITPRDRRFGRQSPTPRHWHSGSSIPTAVFNAHSAIFPRGETYFVETLRYFRKATPPKLAAEIGAFITQEAIHSREHDQLNRRAHLAGYDMSGLERKVADRLAGSANRPFVRLACTIALEHFTAIFAHQLLGNPRHLRGSDPETAELWRWHACEEIEHKAVAYDTWLHVTRQWTRKQRWLFKARMMLAITRFFIRDRTAGALELMRQDGVMGWKAKAKLLWYLWGSPGLYRHLIVPWIKYFLPRFHPWNEDDRYLLQAYEAKEAMNPASVPERKVRRAV